MTAFIIACVCCSGFGLLFRKLFLRQAQDVKCAFVVELLQLFPELPLKLGERIHTFGGFVDSITAVLGETTVYLCRGRDGADYRVRYWVTVRRSGELVAQVYSQHLPEIKTVFIRSHAQLEEAMRLENEEKIRSLCVATLADARTMTLSVGGVSMSHAERGVGSVSCCAND